MKRLIPTIVIVLLVAVIAIMSVVWVATSQKAVANTTVPTVVPKTSQQAVSGAPVVPTTALVSKIAQLDNPKMTNYQKSLSYQVPQNLQVPGNLLNGFQPVPSLVKTDFVFPDGKLKVALPAIPDLTPYRFFPQDDPKNPSPVWKVPIASYRDGENKWPPTTDGWFSTNIESFNWIVYTGETICLPSVGCIKDPNGGAAMILLVNFHDSDEAWDVRNDTAAYMTAGFYGFGKMWDLSGASYDLGVGIAAIRNHYLYNLGQQPDYAGQCGSSGLCKTVTYVVVARVWDRPEIGIKFSHFELIDSGQFRRN